MARAPFQVSVFPYRRGEGGELEYALFRRSAAGYWQAVAGGGEDGETVLQAAARESFEETGLAGDAAFLRLSTVVSVPVTEFLESHLWGDELYVIPQHYFGLAAPHHELRLSREHTEFRWLRYDEALARLHWDGDKVALWELDRRLRRLGPRD